MCLNQLTGWKPPRKPSRKALDTISAGDLELSANVYTPLAERTSQRNFAPLRCQLLLLANDSRSDDRSQTSASESQEAPAILIRHSLKGTAITIASANVANPEISGVIRL
jgi:hypothetical protein